LNCKKRDVKEFNREIGMKVINPTSTFKDYMETQIRYLNYVCAIKRIDMLSAIEKYSHRFKLLYLKKHVY